MAKCKTCGREFTIREDASLSTSFSRDLLLLSRFRLGRLVGVENGWLIGGIIACLAALTIAMNAANIWIRDLSILAFFAVAFIVSIVLFRKVRFSRLRSHNCPECSNAIIARQLLRPGESGPHKIVTHKKRV